MCVTPVVCHVAMSFVHRPIVLQSIHIVILGQILLCGCHFQVPADAVEAQVVNGTSHATKIHVVVVVIVNGLYNLYWHRLIRKERQRGGTILCQCRKSEVSSVATHSKVDPLSHGQHVLADHSCSCDIDDHVSLVVNADDKAPFTMVKNRARFSPHHPEFDAEVAIDKDGVDRTLHTIVIYHDLRHVVLHGLTVELGGNDDVLVTDIAGHDVFVELHHDVVAVAQYAVCRRGCGELSWSLVILYHGNLLAVDVDFIFAILCHSVGTESVGALWVEVGIAHVVLQTQVALGRKRLATQFRRFLLVNHELQL